MPDNEKPPTHEKNMIRPEQLDNQTAYTTIDLPPEYVHQHPQISHRGMVFLTVMTVLYVLFVILPAMYLLLLLLNPAPDAGFGLLFVAPFLYLTLVLTTITKPVLLLRYKSDRSVSLRAGLMLGISVILIIILVIPKSSTV
jgi:hypothetical protein